MDSGVDQTRWLGLNDEIKWRTWLSRIATDLCTKHGHQEKLTTCISHLSDECIFLSLLEDVSLFNQARCGTTNHRLVDHDLSPHCSTTISRYIYTRFVLYCQMRGIIPCWSQVDHITLILGGEYI